MLYLRVTVMLLVAALLSAGAAFQEKDKDGKKDDKTAKKDKDDKPPVKLKGFLPAHYKKLGLSDEQRQRIYKVQAEYKEKLDEIEKAKAKLKAELKAETEKVLTPKQLQELKKIRSGG